LPLPPLPLPPLPLPSLPHLPLPPPPQGIPGWSRRLEFLLEEFGEAYAAASPDMQVPCTMHHMHYAPYAHALCTMQLALTCRYHALCSHPMHTMRIPYAHYAHTLHNMLILCTPYRWGMVTTTTSLGRPILL
jgi:hypothetical protein